MDQAKKLGERWINLIFDIIINRDLVLISSY
jgi:hypothetical protein